MKQLTKNKNKNLPLTISGFGDGNVQLNPTLLREGGGSVILYIWAASSGCLNALACCSPICGSWSKCLQILDRCATCFQRSSIPSCKEGNAKRLRNSSLAHNQLPLLASP